MKNKIYIILIVAFLVFISFYYGKAIKSNALSANDVVINSYYIIRDYIVENTNKHFYQAEQIENLKIRNKNLEEANALLATFSNQLNQLLEDKNSTQYLPKVSLVRALSYVQIGNYQRLWLNTPKIDLGKNRGLIYQGYAVGVATNKEGRTMAILQGDNQCIFSVNIGDKKAPGVLQGNNGKIMVHYIPKYENINIGDEVLTSGLDGVFFSGIPVGKVTKVIEDNLYQSVELESFAKVSVPIYMYMVESF